MSDVFGMLCDLTDDLQRLCPQVQPDAVRCMLGALVERLDNVIDQTVCFIPVEMTDEESDNGTIVPHPARPDAPGGAGPRRPPGAGDPDDA